MRIYLSALIILTLLSHCKSSTQSNTSDVIGQTENGTYILFYAAQDQDKNAYICRTACPDKFDITQKDFRTKCVLNPMVVTREKFTQDKNATAYLGEIENSQLTAKSVNPTDRADLKIDGVFTDAKALNKKGLQDISSGDPKVICLDPQNLANAGKAAKIPTAPEIKDGVVVLNGHSHYVSSVSFSSDSSLLVSGSWDSKFKIWDVKTGKEKMSFDEDSSVFSAAFSPDDSKIITASDGTKVWELKSGKKILQTDSSSAYSAYFSPDGSTFVTARNKSARISDAESGRTILDFTPTNRSQRLNAAIFSADGRILLAASDDDTTASMWDVKSGLGIGVLTGHTAWVAAAAFSRDNTMVLTGSADGTAKTWDIKSAKMLKTLPGYSGEYNSVALSPDASLAAIGFRAVHGVVKIWDLKSETVVKTLEGHSDSIYSVAFSPDGLKVATGSRDKTIRIWDVSDLKK